MKDGRMFSSNIITTSYKNSIVYKYTFSGLLFAVFSISLICTVMSVDDGLLSDSVSCIVSNSSLTLYDD